MAAAEETFQRLVAQLDYPMFIATVTAGGERAGCLIGRDYPEPIVDHAQARREAIERYRV